MRSRLGAICGAGVPPANVTRRIAAGLLLAALAVLQPPPAYAHKINVFASAEGKTIRGKVYFQGGAPAQGVTVTAVGPAQQPLGETKTDEAGRFTLVADHRCDYRLVADVGDGHGGDFTLSASALPEDLPPLPASAEMPPAVGAGQTPKQSAAPLPPSPGGLSADEQFKLLRAEIVRLEEQLRAYEDRVRFADILGGIGYIAGITGAAFYYLGARRKKTS
jgi:nickel transport protein